MRALLLLLILLCPMLAAQDPDGQARRIKSQPEYKGYRVEKPPGSQPGNPGDSGQPSDAGDGASDGASDGGTGRDGGTRRGTGAEGPTRGSGSGGRGGGGGGGGSGLGGLGWLGGVVEVVAWGVLIVGVAVALFFIVKALLGIKWKRKPKSAKSKRSKDAKEGAVETTVAEPEPEVDAQVFEDALELARREYQQALAREDWAAATLLAYRIFWLRAGWQGCVEKSDVRTWRDALRMVRAAEMRAEVRGLLPMVERVRYAEYKPAKAEFNNWTLELEKIEPAGVLQ